MEDDLYRDILRQKIIRAHTVNRNRFDHDVSRHPKFRAYRRGISKLSVDDTVDEAIEINHEPDFLKALGFSWEDVTWMELAYGNRLINIGTEPVNLVKVAIGEFFEDKNLDRYIPSGKGSMLKDFVSYLQILGGHWVKSGTDYANEALNRGSVVLRSEARFEYDGIKRLLESGGSTIDQGARTALEARNKLFERHVLEMQVKPLERIAYEGSNTYSMRYNS